MKTATVGEIQKNFSKVINSIGAGEEITVTRRGKAIARITAIGPTKKVDWPEFTKDAIETTGEPLSQLIANGRKERF
ncbi:type II toxin-antitoxin system Phd/YefM family antitoxin [bacterium]|nr:type II toxin-antitoxin system Phd/YefM family antitoxin [bacterium]